MRLNALVSLACAALAGSLGGCEGSEGPTRAAESANDATSASSEASAASATTERGERSEAGKVQIVVSVDWEGDDLLAANLEAMKAFRRGHPDVPLVQFLNAAYYFKPDADAARTTSRIASVLSSGDELGLHIHGWRRLFEASGVPFRSSPTFWGTSIDLRACTYDCGHDVPLGAYTTGELRSVIRSSMTTLRAQGFATGTSFRAGGWMAPGSVLEALTAEGITVDASAANVPLLADELAGRPIVAWLRQLWGSVSSTTQPFEVRTGSGSLKELPDNGALADYVTAEEMVSVFQAHKARLSANPQADTVMSIGFHQETAQRFLPRIEAAIAEIRRVAAAEQVPVAFVTTRSVK